MNSAMSPKSPPLTYRISTKSYSSSLSLVDLTKYDEVHARATHKLEAMTSPPMSTRPTFYSMNPVPVKRKDTTKINHREVVRLEKCPAFRQYLATVLLDPVPQPNEIGVTTTKLSSKVPNFETVKNHIRGLRVMPHCPTLSKSGRKTCLKYMQSLTFERDYLERLLQDENLRFIYLRQGRGSTSGQHGLWTETLLNAVQKNTHDVKHLLNAELAYIDKQCVKHEELNYWTSLQQKANFSRDNQDWIRLIKLKRTYEKTVSMRQYAEEGQTKCALKQGKRILRRVKRWKENDSDSFKWPFLAEIYYLLTLIHLQDSNTNEAKVCAKKEMEIARKCHIGVCLTRLTDNLARIEAFQGNYLEAIKIYESRLKTLATPLEKSWAYHEIARCHAYTYSYHSAISFGERAVSTARLAKSIVWEVNSLLLISCASMMEGSLHSNYCVQLLYKSLKNLQRAYRCSLCFSYLTLRQEIVKVIVTIYEKFKFLEVHVLKKLFVEELYDVAFKATNKATENINNNQNKLNTSGSNAACPRCDSINVPTMMAGHKCLCPVDITSRLQEEMMTHKKQTHRISTRRRMLKRRRIKETKAFYERNWHKYHDTMHSRAGDKKEVKLRVQSKVEDDDLKQKKAKPANINQRRKTSAISSRRSPVCAVRFTTPINSSTPPRVALPSLVNSPRPLSLGPSPGSLQYKRGEGRNQLSRYCKLRDLQVMTPVISRGSEEKSQEAQSTASSTTSSFTNCRGSQMMLASEDDMVSSSWSEG